MTRRSLLLALGLLSCAAPAHADTLREAIAAAYATNPELAEARARQDALAEADNFAAIVELRDTVRAVETAWPEREAARRRESVSRQVLEAAQLALARARSDLQVAQASALRASGMLDREAF